MRATSGGLTATHVHSDAAIAFGQAYALAFRLTAIPSSSRIARIASEISSSSRAINRAIHDRHAAAKRRYICANSRPIKLADDHQMFGQVMTSIMLELVR
jgi:hypothetical protein